MCLLIYLLEQKLSSNAVQTILTNTRMNVQLNIQLSQGSAATNLRGGGKFYSSYVRFISEYNSERIIKIGPHLPKLF